ncbi:MAG TPA: CHC2 zinc finger domain-containing protein, partial [Agitococcus sp.]|nr:CHC2 zinc finger domain-containing protein [Agitococcus sp.]
MAGRIAQNFIDEVLRRTDIVDLIGSYVRLKKAGKNYSACCPFHHEKTPSFSVNRDKQFYHCFGCGASGNALSFV